MGNLVAPCPKLYHQLQLDRLAVSAFDLALGSACRVRQRLYDLDTVRGTACRMVERHLLRARTGSGKEPHAVAGTSS